MWHDLLFYYNLKEYMGLKDLILAKNQRLNQKLAQK